VTLALLPVLLCVADSVLLLYSTVDRAFCSPQFQNITLIKDDTDAVCYVMKLDRERIPAPKTYLELLYRIAVSNPAYDLLLGSYVLIG